MLGKRVVRLSLAKSFAIYAINWMCMIAVADNQPMAVHFRLPVFVSFQSFAATDQTDDCKHID
jgi:hypothetical protein